MINILALPVAPLKNHEPRAHKPYKGRKGGVRANTAEILWMRAAGKTLEEIGQAFGVCRERVRQILKQSGIVGVREKPTKSRPPRIKNFKIVMRRWLHWAGFSPCGQCHTIKTINEFSPSQVGHICLPCQAQRMHERYASSEQVRLKCKEYTRTAATRGYFKEYYQRPGVRELASVKGKARYLEMRSDPERWEKYKAKQREYRLQKYHVKKSLQ